MLPCSHAALPWFQNREFFDAQNFPNDVCIRWDAVADREKLIEMGHYAGLETPRLDHIALPYKVSRDQIAPESAVQTQYNVLTLAITAKAMCALLTKCDLKGKLRQKLKFHQL